MTRSPFAQALLRTAALTLSLLPGAALLIGDAASPAAAAEADVLRPTNFDDLAPRGREADAIYGDYVLRNDRIVAAVGNPQIIGGRSSSRRHPRQIGGALIDLTPRSGPGAQNDQLGWFYMGMRMGNNHSDFQNGTANYQVDYADGFKPLAGESVTISLPHYPHHPEKFEGFARYTLKDGWSYVLSEVEYAIPAGSRPAPDNSIPKRKPPADDAEALDRIAKDPPPNQTILPAPDEVPPPIEPVVMAVSPGMGIATDAVVERGADVAQHLVWVYDPWYGQAYGVVSEPTWTHVNAKGAQRVIPAEGALSLLPGERLIVRRRVIVAADLFGVRSIANEILGQPQRRVRFTARASDGPVANARVNAYLNPAATKAAFYAAGRTNAQGVLEFDLPEGAAELRVEAIGRQPQSARIAPDAREASLAFEPAASVAFQVTDEQAQPIPCKIEFRGQGPTPTPEFFNINGESEVQNLRYTSDGLCTQILEPGKYQVIITRGPAYDAVIMPVDLAPGQKQTLRATLRRSVNTSGWISADLHAYTTVSGPTNGVPYSGASRLGRVLNLACEDVQFAQGAEFDIVSTFEPEIQQLGLERFIATCPGIVLSDNGKYAYNEQIAFPIEYKPHWQDGGAIARPQHCGQIEWLRSWGAPIDPLNPWLSARVKGYDKLMVLLQRHNTPPKAQLRVPMSSMFRDRDVPAWWNDDSALTRPMYRDTDDDGIPDRVHHNFAAAMDALDVRSLEPLLNPKVRLPNDVVDWLNMRASGYRMTGLANSGAFHNFHGAGGVRNYIHIPGKTLADLKPSDVIQAVRAGHVVMSTGPFLETTLTTAEGKTAITGDLIATDARVAKLHVRVQCPNWITLDHVLVLRNGTTDRAINFSREAAPDRFASPGAPVAFDQTFDVPVEADTQFLVMVRGHGPNLRQQLTPADTVAKHVALGNPILVDRGGDGFVPQSPVHDQVEAFLRLIRPVKSDPKSPPGLVRLTLINHGDTPARDTVRLDLRPASVARLLGPKEVPFTVEPGKKTHIDVEIGLLTDAQTEALLGSRPKARLTLYVPRIPRAPGVAPARLPFIVDDFAKMGDLDEKDPGELDLTEMR